MSERFHYVYILVSIDSPGRHYVGLTDDLVERLARHNRGEVTHTRKFIPWRIETAIAFRGQAKTVAFEKYLKSGSGRTFSRRHF